jgi:serine/threonine protein kinase
MGSEDDLSLIDGCMLMEILEGIKEEGTGGLSESHCVALIRQAVLGLRHMHSNGRVHGALEPANIFLESATGTVKLAEGVASTPYMAPEVCAAHRVCAALDPQNKRVASNSATHALP